MEDKTLKRLDGMITKHQLLIAETGAQRGVVPDDLIAQINRLENGLYSLREGMHGFMKAKEYGFPLERLDGYIESIEEVADRIDKSLLAVIVKMHASIK